MVEPTSVCFARTLTLHLKFKNAVHSKNDITHSHAWVPFRCFRDTCFRHLTL